MPITKQIAQTLSIPLAQVQAALDLLDSGNTLPFVARYRKEATGGLDEEQLRNISILSESLRALADRRQTVLDSIREQGKLTPELEAQILAVQSRTELEDLYQPFRPKRRTRASMAREKGLQPLADLILAQPGGRANPPKRWPAPSSPRTCPQWRMPWPAHGTSSPRRSPTTRMYAA